MGNDGHTASLFPGSAAIHEPERWVASLHVKKLDSWRVTLTPQAFLGAKRIAVMVTGESKAECLKEVHQGEFNPDRLPVQSIRSGVGHIIWMVDKPAASRLDL
jgi:6-phosphogluconolactonase